MVTEGIQYYQNLLCLHSISLILPILDYQGQKLKEVKTTEEYGKNNPVNAGLGFF